MPPPPTPVPTLKVEAPILKDLTIDNITENVNRINSQTPDARLKYIMERLVSHMHDFARETRLSTDEWMAGIEFLTAVGKKCTDVRQEFILLSDTLGLSLLIDSLSHPKNPLATEGTVLGPYHTHDATSQPLGSAISHDTDGTPLLCLCTIKDSTGAPIPGVKIDVWETDSHGVYDVQYAEYTSKEGVNGRAVLESDHNGVFWYKAIVPVPYSIPDDGPVGRMLKVLGRHSWRPSHMHFLFEKPGFEKLVTALYLRNDPYETTDAVFGVKQSLIVDLSTVDTTLAQKYGVEAGTTKLLTYDFVLATEDETRRLRDEEAVEAVRALGREDLRVVDGLPVLDVD